jgi:predicted DNA-binding protein (UPF0251 family)
MNAPRIHILGVRADGGYAPLLTHPVTRGRPVVIGREGELAVGIDPFDPKVSRNAVTVTSVREGWRLEVGNYNGVDLQLWGQPALPYRPVEPLSWPRIAVCVKGDRLFRHLVLLDDPARAISVERPRHVDQLTESLTPPPPLTMPQQEALRLLYAELLAWPPPKQAVPLRINQVAHRLRISSEAVRRRLEEARQKAIALGLNRAVPLTDPEYLYVLVRAGYLPPSHEDLDRVLRRG